MSEIGCEAFWGGGGGGGGSGFVVTVCVQFFIYGFEFDGRGNSKVWC